MQELQGEEVRLTFRVSDEQQLIITPPAVAQMLSFAQRRWYQPEAGGVLLGRHLLESNHLVVDEVTVPQRSDRRSRFGFFRSASHNKVAQEKWADSAGTLAYLGLWHTHPERVPNPSQVDCEDWEKAVAHHAFVGDKLFFPIIGTERIRVWAKSRTGPIYELAALE